ncbi:MAG: winged helix-turn-helix transcriptional regulator, partial [Desulfobacterales bacterium]|nr:winged helix-turn-helix transcriptional regulator [Desulfobacterales bacterium]
KSKLYQESASMSVEELADKMNLSQGAKEHLFPKNVGLLMFSENPDKFFNGVQIDVVEFPDGLGAKEFNEKTFKGTIQKQLTDALSYLKANIIKSKVIKYADRAESDTVFNYPYEALEESLANAVYHRNYELRDPIEVRVLPDTIEIISYNGVDPSLKQIDFDRGVVKARRYRNRRIGEFLKELNLTEGRGTGLPTILRVLSKNGSSAPIFDTNEPERSFFITELLIHPDFHGGLVEGLVEGLVDSQKKIVDLVIENPNISKKEMSEYIGISTTAIDKNIAALKKKNIIRRIGGAKGGHWEILEIENKR